MRNKAVLLFGLLLMVQQIFAQQADPDVNIDRRNSPYSVYGLGDLINQGFAFNRALGGTTTSFKSPFNVNPQNPATYADFLITSLDFGFHLNGYNLRTLNENLNASDMNVTYFSMGFPLAKNLGFAAGVMPMSKVSYSIFEDDDTGDLGTTRTLFSGDGDVYRSFYGVGYGFGNKMYSVTGGVNYNLVFGKVDRIVESFLPDASSYLWTRRRKERSYRGGFLQYGMQFSFKPKEESKLVVIAGLSGDVATKVNVDLADIWERTAGGGLELEVDRTSREDEVTLPSRIAAGISLQNADGWSLGFEIERSNWSEFRGFEGFELNNSFRDGTKYSLGFMITPDRTDFNSYLKTIQYRAGLYYNSGFLSPQNPDGPGNTDISEFGVTFGFGLPVRRNSTRLPNYSRLNLSFDIGQRGTTDSGFIQENYIKTTFGFTLNDKWFVKKKFD